MELAVEAILKREYRETRDALTLRCVAVAFKSIKKKYSIDIHVLNNKILVCRALCMHREIYSLLLYCNDGENVKDMKQDIC